MRVKPSGPIYNRAGMPFAWYLMDRPHGTFPSDAGDVADATRRRRAIIRQAGCSYGNGPAGRCLKFDGSSNAYASTPDNLPLSGNPAFTIAFSFFTSSSSARGLFGFGNTSGVATAFGVFYALQGSGVLSVEYANGNSAYVNTSVPVGMWHRAVVTKSPGAINATTRIHVDGINQGAMNGASSSSTPNITLSPFTLGRFADDIFDATLSGSLDNVQIYDYVWTDADIRKDIRDPFWRLRRPSRLLVGTPVSVFAQIPDGGFEVPALGAGAYQLNPPLAAGQPWTFVGNAGVSRNGSAFTTGAEPAPEGNQLALIQSVASFSQDLPFASATYSLSFWTRQRLGNNQDFNVLLDATVIDHVVPDIWAKTIITGLVITAGTHTLTFQGLNPGDNTCFIDDVQFSPPIVATAYTVTGPSSGFAGVPSTNFTITPNAVTSGTVHITATFTGTGAPAPQIFTFASSLTPQTFTITPTAVSADITITFTNDDLLTNQAALHYAAAAGNAYTVTGPASGLSGQASAVFTITPNGLINTTITATPSGCGLSAPIVKTFSSNATPQTFTLTPTTAGSVSLVFTNGGSLTNQSALTYLVSSYVAKGIESIDFGAGWTGNAFQLNGAGATYSGTVLQLVASGGSASSFSWLPLPIGGFAIEFTAQLPVTAGRGLALVLQNQGATARGTGALGVTGITPAMALELDTSALTGAGANTLCLVTTTPSMSQPADLAAHANVHLHGGYPVRVRCRYDGTTLRVWTTDTSTGAVAMEEFTVDLPTILGGATAHIGFTSNAASAVNILTFVYDDLSGTPPPIGNTTDALAPFGGDQPFADMMVFAYRFGNAVDPTSHDQPIDAEGWPFGEGVDGIGTVFAIPQDPPYNHFGGLYTWRFTGQAATITIPLTSGTLTVNPYDAGTNTTSGTIQVNSDSSYITLGFRGTKRLPGDAPGTGLTNLQMMRPLTPGASTSYPYGTFFADHWTAFSRKIDVLRWMSMQGINFDTQDWLWSARPLPGRPQGINVHGISFEYTVLMCNNAHADGWWCVPVNVTDDWIDNFADLLKNGTVVDGITYPPLDPELKAYLEVGNESTFNTLFQTFQVNAGLANAEPGAGPSNLNFDGNANSSGEWWFRRYGREIKRVSDRFRLKFGDAQMGSRIRPLYNGRYDGLTTYGGLWFLDSYYNKTNPLSDYSGTPHPVNYWLWGGGCGWYQANTNAGNTDPNVLYASPVVYPNSVDLSVVVMHTWGLHVVGYEGGWYIPKYDAIYEPGGNTNQVAITLDARSRAVNAQSINDYISRGGELPMAFATASTGSWYQLYPDILSPDQPKWLGVQDVRALPPVPVTAGITLSATEPTSWGITDGALPFGGARPNTGDSASYMINCTAPGRYTLSTSLYQAGTFGQALVFVNGQQIGGAVNMAPVGNIDLGDIPLKLGLNTVGIFALHAWADPTYGTSAAYWQTNGFTLTPTAEVAALAGPTPVATLSAESITAGGSATATITWAGGNPHGVPVVVTLTPSVGTCTPSTVTLSSDASDNQITTLDIPGGTSTNFHTLTLTNTLGLSKSVIGFSVGIPDVPTSLSSSDSSTLATSTSTSAIINRTDSFICGERTSKDSNSIGLLTSGPGNIIY